MSIIPLELPELRIVPLAALRLHETCDEARVQRLMARLENDGLLRNPPIVALLDDGENYVVLDGATRTTALQRLKVRDVLVQVVNYNETGVELHTWHHLVAGISLEACTTAICEVAGLSLSEAPPLEAQLAVERGEALAAVVWNNGVTCTIGRQQVQAPDLKTHASLLVRMVDAYLDCGAKIFRLGTDHFGPSAARIEGATALVVFPRVQPADILELAANSARLPAGITRHVIPNRALRVNLPLSFLRQARSLEAKNAWLAGMVRQKTIDKGIRYYAEPTFVFDE